MQHKLHRYEHDVTGIPLPRQFTWPFHYVPHRLSVLAAEQTMRHVASHPEWATELRQGKMLGVLVVLDNDGEPGFLAAYSGNLCGRNDHAFFVPPVCDLLQPDSEFRRGEAAISAINHELACLEHSPALHHLQQQLQQQTGERDRSVAKMKQDMSQCKARRDALRAAAQLNDDELRELTAESQHQKAELKRLRRHHEQLIERTRSALDELQAHIDSLKAERKQRSEALQERIFGMYVVQNARGQRTDLAQLWPGTLPPAGSGDCCGPKLLQYAYSHGLHPVGMAEFWYGRSPQGEVRHHGHYYPACRSKCLPILSFMLQGLDVEPNPLAVPCDMSPLDIAHDDAWLTVVRKPAGLLSVPGKLLDDSVELRYRRRGDVSGPVVVHRLDQETSGLLLLAKNKTAHKALQQLFATGQVVKTYTALLQGHPPASEGIIDLPLRPDAADRPRQVVDLMHGRRAVSRYRVLACHDALTRVELQPLTGRTHQLRVHCSHRLGLGVPIVGDMLYGTASTRLMLHAARLQLIHPMTGQPLDITWPAPF